MLQIGRRARFLVLSCLLLSSAVTGGGYAARHARKSKPAQTAGSLRQRLSSLKAQTQQTRQRLHAAKARVHAVNQHLQQIDHKLAVTENHYQAVTRDVHVAHANLQVATSHLRRARATLSDRREDVADRLVAIYKEGETSPLEVVLQVQSMDDLSNRMYLLNAVAKHDAQVLDDLSEARQRAESKRREVAVREQDLSELQQAVAVQKQAVAVQREQTAQEKLSALREKLVLEQQLAEMEASSNEIRVLLQRMLQRPARGRGGNYTVTPWHGSLARPVSGRITSGFGSRFHPILHVMRRHTGVDIAASSGTPIHAAAGGVVVYAGWMRGYGNCIVVNHGGGLATVYGHCSGLAVGSGQKVSQGQVVGYVGMTGLATGPHLHFEVRRNGTPVNPL